MLYDIPREASQTSLGNTSYMLDCGFYPLYPFGYGLSYTEFGYSAPVLDRQEYSPDDVIRVTFTLTNTGRYAATEVAQLYVRDLIGSSARPVKELKGFRRISLDPGESGEYTFELPVQDLAFYGLDMTRKVEPGDFHLWVAGDSVSGEPVSFSVVAD